MNSPTSARACQGPIQASAAADRFEREQALQRAVDISVLIQWIEAARFVGHEINLWAAQDPSLKAALDRWDVRYGAYCWGDDPSDALSTLLALQQELIATGGGLN